MISTALLPAFFALAEATPPEDPWRTPLSEGAWVSWSDDALVVAVTVQPPKPKAKKRRRGRRSAAKRPQLMASVRGAARKAMAEAMDALCRASSSDARCDALAPEAFAVLSDGCPIRVQSHEAEEGLHAEARCALGAGFRALLGIDAPTAAPLNDAKGGTKDGGTVPSAGSSLVVEVAAAGFRASLEPRLTHEGRVVFGPNSVRFDVLRRRGPAFFARDERALSEWDGLGADPVRIRVGEVAAEDARTLSIRAADVERLRSLQGALAAGRVAFLPVAVGTAEGAAKKPSPKE